MVHTFVLGIDTPVAEVPDAEGIAAKAETGLEEMVEVGGEDRAGSEMREAPSEREAQNHASRTSTI